MFIPRRIVLVLVLLVLVVCAWWAPLDQPALQQVDAGLKRALVSFATARALNGVISVAQGTEIALQPAGVGATLAPGQLLDPVNDLVEQFAQLMLIASVALGVEKILIGIGSDWTMSLALTIVTLMFSVLLISGRRVGSWLPRLLAILLMLRFAVPVVVMGTDVVWHRFLAEEYRSNQQAIATTTQIAAAQDSATGSDGSSTGVVERIRSWLTRASDVKARFDDLRQIVERAIDHIIRLMVVFVLQTAIIPGLLLWLIWTFARVVVDPGRGRWDTFASAGARTDDGRAEPIPSDKSG